MKSSKKLKDINQFNLAVIVPPGKEPYLTQPGDKPPSPAAPGYIWVQVPLSNSPVNGKTLYSTMSMSSQFSSKENLGWVLFSLMINVFFVIYFSFVWTFIDLQLVLVEFLFLVLDNAMAYPYLNSLVLFQMPSVFAFLVVVCALLFIF